MAPKGYKPTEAPLIPKLRGQYAEFLNQRSPERLRLLVLPTCVSFSTVNPLQRLEAFLGRVAKNFSNINAIEFRRRFTRADLPIPHRPRRYGRF